MNLVRSKRLIVKLQSVGTALELKGQCFSQHQFELRLIYHHIVKQFKLSKYE